MFLDQFPIRVSGERIVAFDWHQVSDAFRFNSRSCERLSDQYVLPDGVLQSFREVADAKRDGDLVIVLSHIHQSQYNGDQLLWAVYINQLPIDLVVITKERCGVAGKLYALGALSPYSTECCLVDDNIEIALEFAAFNEHFPSESRLEFFHVRVPKKPTCEETGFPSAWNVQGHLAGIRDFLNRGRH